MEDYREIGPPGNGKTRKTGASNLAAVRETTRHVRIHASRVIFRGAQETKSHWHPYLQDHPFVLAYNKVCIKYNSRYFISIFPKVFQTCRCYYYIFLCACFNDCHVSHFFERKSRPISVLRRSIWFFRSGDRAEADRWSLRLDDASTSSRQFSLCDSCGTGSKNGGRGISNSDRLSYAAVGRHPFQPTTSSFLEADGSIGFFPARRSDGSGPNLSITCHKSDCNRVPDNCWSV